MTDITPGHARNKFGTMACDADNSSETLKSEGGGAISEGVACQLTIRKPSGTSRAAFSRFRPRVRLWVSHRRSCRL